MDVIYRFDPDLEPPAPPATPGEAAERLRRGNEEFVRLSGAEAGTDGTRIVKLPLGWYDPYRSPGRLPEQAPFAVVLGCSDARVPTEILFNQPRNDLFIVRVAGNVLGSECLGSVEFATENLARNLRLVVVLGHSSCGAVTAAVDAFLDPAIYPDIASSQALRAVIDRIFISVRASRRALRAAWGDEAQDRDGYRAALIEVTVGFNAALTAWTLRSELSRRVLERVDVVFGVFDMMTHEVLSPAGVEPSLISPGLVAAPTDRESFRELGRVLAKSERVRSLLDG